MTALSYKDLLEPAHLEAQNQLFIVEYHRKNRLRKNMESLALNILENKCNTHGAPCSFQHMCLKEMG